MNQLRFAFDRFSVALRIARRRTARRLVKAGLRCPECKGKGIVVNCEIVEFIEEIGLPAYYAAMMLAHRADQIGGADSLPASSWKDVGLSDYQARVFLDDIRDAWPVWECSLCSTASPEHITEQAFEKVQKVAIAHEQPSTKGANDMTDQPNKILTRGKIDASKLVTTKLDETNTRMPARQVPALRSPSNPT